MKRAVSISIGSSTRDKTVEIKLLGETIRMERIGTDGDMEKAAALYRELDGQVDAFGVGGAVLGLMLEDRWYTLNSVRSLVRYIHHTPVVDGTGLKMTLERKAAAVVDEQLCDVLVNHNALLISGVDRYGLSRSFMDAGYDCVIGDLMFTIGLPIPIRSDRALKRVANALIPIVGRLPFEWMYPTGEKQETRTPKFTKYFEQAGVIAGDCHYITHYMPDDMHGKIIVTNTTTPADRELLRSCGIRHLVTTTPVFEERSFGTNMMEAAIIAALGRKERVDYANCAEYMILMEEMVDQLHLVPQVQEL
ncbi:MAG: hypothetical protein RBT34_13555 [Anaerolineaceae bacterium]|jgi:hypothetical protein|nr:hypothetical protein [Anaerolineaceae bacterium]